MKRPRFTAGKRPVVRVSLAAVVGVVVAALVSAGGPADAAHPKQGRAQVTAHCFNTTGDSTMINQVIGRSAPGAQVFLSGPCLITRTVKLLGDRTYTGGSRTGTVLKQADGANLQAMMASDSYLDNSATTGTPVAVRHMTLDGNRARNIAATDGLLIRSWQTTLQDLYITGMGGDGIRLTNLSANGTALTNTQVNGEIQDNFIENSGESGLYVQDTGNSNTDWHLRNNFFAGSGADAVHLDNAAGWMIERNHVYDVGGTAIFADRLFGTTITDNLIEDFGKTPTAGTWYGIQGTVQGDSGSTIDGNRIFSYNAESNTKSRYRYLALTKVNYGTGAVAVTGNVTRGAGTTRGTGLYYDTAGGGPLELTSSGNLVYNVHKPEHVGAGVVMVPAR